MTRGWQEINSVFPLGKIPSYFRFMPTLQSITHEVTRDRSPESRVPPQTLFSLFSAISGNNTQTPEPALLLGPSLLSQPFWITQPYKGEPPGPGGCCGLGVRAVFSCEKANDWRPAILSFPAWSLGVNLSQTHRSPSVGERALKGLFCVGLRQNQYIAQQGPSLTRRCLFCFPGDLCMHPGSSESAESLR